MPRPAPMAERLASELRWMEGGHGRYTREQTWQRCSDVLRDGYRRDARHIIALLDRYRREARTMTQPEPDWLQRLTQVAALRPGDILLLHLTDAGLDAEESHNIRDDLKRDYPDLRTIIVSAGIEISIIRTSEAGP